MAANARRWIKEVEEGFIQTGWWVDRPRTAGRLRVGSMAGNEGRTAHEDQWRGQDKPDMSSKKQWVVNFPVR